jgi:hypothetical protein
MHGVRICCHGGFSEEASYQGIRSTEDKFSVAAKACVRRRDEVTDSGTILLAGENNV